MSNRRPTAPAEPLTARYVIRCLITGLLLLAVIAVAHAFTATAGDPDADTTTATASPVQVVDRTATDAEAAADPESDPAAARDALASSTPKATDYGDRPTGQACWTEPKPVSDGGPEKICGDTSKAPADAYGFTAYPGAGQSMPTTATAHHVPSGSTSSATSGAAEDSAGFDCETDGNRTCGPNNPQGATPGCYDNVVPGKLLAAWQPAMYGHWINCGTPSQYDIEQEAKLDGQVPQVCKPNNTGGTTCTWADGS